jgi:hypothetical protein
MSFSQDGTVIPSIDEEHMENRIRRIFLEQKEIVKKVNEKRAARLRRLHELGRVNEVIFTKDGVYEMDAYRRPIHQTSARNNRADIAKHKKPKKKKQFRVEKVQQEL